jgi:hypothetical protein
MQTKVINAQTGNVLFFLPSSSRPDRGPSRVRGGGLQSRPNQGGPRDLDEQTQLESSGTQQTQRKFTCVYQFHGIRITHGRQASLLWLEGQ